MLLGMVGSVINNVSRSNEGDEVKWECTYT